MGQDRLLYLKGTARGRIAMLAMVNLRTYLFHSSRVQKQTHLDHRRLALVLLHRTTRHLVHPITRRQVRMSGGPQIRGMAGNLGHIPTTTVVLESRHPTVTNTMEATSIIPARLRNGGIDHQNLAVRTPLGIMSGTAQATIPLIMAPLDAPVLLRHSLTDYPNALICRLLVETGEKTIIARALQTTS